MSDSVLTRLAAMGRDIKLAHSVFALPFALLATFLAAGSANREPGWDELGLIVACMFFARTFAMLSNRYVDRKIDATNPRTAGRGLPSGRLRPREVMITMVVCVIALACSAAGFGLLRGNWWPLMLSPIAIIWLGAYGLVKRFSAAAHFVLGAALGLSPIGAAIAVEPSFVIGSIALWALAGFVMLWVGGFDIIYALQDLDVDREEGLHSIPAKLGRDGSLLAAKLTHLAALGLLVAVQANTPAFAQHRIIASYQISYFTLAMIITALLLLWEHRAAKRDQFTMAFFTLNGVISCMLGAAGIADLLLWHPAM